MICYIETGKGCGLRSGRSVDAVRSAELRSVGTSEGVQICRKATERDIAWVQGMGGHVPEESRE